MATTAAGRQLWHQRDSAEPQTSATASAQPLFLPLCLCVPGSAAVSSFTPFDWCLPSRAADELNFSNEPTRPVKLM